MGIDDWDALEESLAESVLADRVRARSAVVRTCQSHPSASVQHLTLALASMAAVLEQEWLSGSLAEQQQLLEVYRSMIALSADLAVLDLGTAKRKTCTDLLAYWQRTNDAFFVVDTPQ